MSDDNSAEHPWSVKDLNIKLGQYISKLGHVWIEGQLTQITARRGTRTAFMTLRDTSSSNSLSVTCSPDLVSSDMSDGCRVVMFGKMAFWESRGSLQFRASDIRAVGVGEMLTKVELLRERMRVEGLFDVDRKLPFPFLPRRVGLITGRASAAERDVVSVAESRWPSVRFRVVNATVQGASAVSQICKALSELDDDPLVDVIILARGGGSVEDLLPFSDEALCRTIAGCSTPVVSAIGHEPDSPLCDHVADLRAATPTDAAKRVVPDASAEAALLTDASNRSANALKGWVARESASLGQIKSRPILADPMQITAGEMLDIARHKRVLSEQVRRGHERERNTFLNYQARLRTLGPQATLERGYAFVKTVHNNHVATSAHNIGYGTHLAIHMSDGVLRASALSPERTP